MKTSVTIEFASENEALAFLQHRAPTISNTPTQMAPPPVTMAAPPPVTMAAPPPPATPPAPVQMAPAGATQQQVVAAMQAYAGVHKAAGVKAAFARYGIPPNVTQLDATQLNTMLQVFQSMQAM